MTNLDILINYVDADVNYETTPADYIVMDLDNDYLIWTEGDATVKDKMTSKPTAEQLNAAATLIDPDAAKTVNLCLLMDDSGYGGYYTREVKGMGLNKRYVFGFSFDDATASEPVLEAWDNSDHDSTDNHVLGAGTPADSMVKAVCTTASSPGSDWVGTAIAGANTLQLNNGNGALAAPASGETTELYANILIKIPAAYATPAVETFCLTVRFTYS
jgi:hypothetical protein